MLHHLTKKSAVDKYKSTPEAELHAVLLKDEKNFSEEDIQEIIAEIKKPAESKVINELPDLSKFDYSKMEAKTLIEYLELLGKTLKERVKYTFAEYRVEIIKGERFEGVEGSPVDIIAVRLKDNKPLKETVSDWKTIKTLNGINILTTRKGDKFITDGQFATASGRPGEGKLYLLKK